MNIIVKYNMISCLKNLKYVAYFCYDYYISMDMWIWTTAMWRRCFYPVHGAKLTLIQPMWSAYQHPLVFLIRYPYLLFFRICQYCRLLNGTPMFCIRRCWGLLRTLYCPRSRQCDVTLIWPLLLHGIPADNANSQWLRAVDRLSIHL